MEFNKNKCVCNFGDSFRDSSNSNDSQTKPTTDTKGRKPFVLNPTCIVQQVDNTVRRVVLQRVAEAKTSKRDVNDIEEIAKLMLRALKKPHAKKFKRIKIMVKTGIDENED